MGQGFSGINPHVLECEPKDWDEYVRADWRSKRARELDAKGGVHCYIDTYACSDVGCCDIA